MDSKTDSAIPFKGQQPYDMPSDLVIPSVVDLSSCDEKFWVPQAPDVSFSLLPLLRSGYFVNILRVRRSGILSRHQHTGPVVAMALKG